MKHHFAAISVFLLLMFAGTGELSAQMTYEEQLDALVEEQEMLQAERQALQEQVQAYRDRYRFSDQRYEDSYREYQDLERQVMLQDETIRQMESEQQQVIRQINLTESNIRELENELNSLIEEYKETLTYLYKHGRTTELALALTASSLNQLLVRSVYLTKFHEHRSAQTDRIAETRETLDSRIESLQQTRQENDALLAEIEEEQRALEEQEQELERIVTLLRQERDMAQSMVDQQEQNIQSLDESLRSYDERYTELMRNRERELAEAMQLEDPEEREAAIERLSRPVMPDTPLQPVEVEAIETSFESARGRLPWPVDGGVVTTRFGNRTHPIIGTQTTTPGVDISVPARSQVRVVHDGFVEDLSYYNGFGDAILVNHGRFRTLYGNLSNILVRKNMIVRQGDVIGQSGDDYSIRGEVLFFLVRDGSQFLNPVPWMQSRAQ